MATCMASYVDGSVLVIEQQGRSWLAARKTSRGDGREVYFGFEPICSDPDNPPVWPLEWTTIECLYALANLEGIERITVNGEQVFPLPPADGSDREDE